MEITKKRMLAALIAAVFMQATSVYAMNDGQGAEQEEDQTYAAEDQCSVVVSEKVAAARVNRSQLKEQEAKELDVELLQAIRESDVDGARELLRKGADVDFVDKSVARKVVACSRNPLLRGIYFCENDSSIEMIELLLQYGADVSATDCQGFTPLMRVLDFGFDSALRPKVIKMLINAGADVNQSLCYDQWQGWSNKCSLVVHDYKPGTTPLMVASLSGDIESTKTLIDAGAHLYAAGDSEVFAHYIKRVGSLKKTKQWKKVKVACTMAQRAQEERKLAWYLVEEDALQQVSDLDGIRNLVTDYVVSARCRPSRSARMIGEFLRNKHIVSVISQYAGLPMVVGAERVAQAAESDVEVAAAAAVSGVAESEDGRA